MPQWYFNLVLLAFICVFRAVEAPQRFHFEVVFQASGSNTMDLSDGSVIEPTIVSLGSAAKALPSWDIPGTDKSTNEDEATAGPGRDHLFKYLLLDNLLPLGTAAGVILLISLIGRLLGVPIRYNAYSAEMLVVGPSFLCLALLICVGWTLVTAKPDQPTSFIVSRLRNEWRGAERIYRGVPLFLILPVFFSVFTSYKSSLGHIIPFYFDPYARYIDQLLHGGDAWFLYSRLIEYPIMTSALNVLYKLWFFILFGLLTFCIFIETDLRARSQYIISFLLCWFVIGVVAATALSSAGPCYYKHFFGDPSFDYISQYLGHVAERYPVPALFTQKYILGAYVSGEPGIGDGISAAPSMHVSMAALTALFLSRYGRVATVIGWTYCALILLASVHLGWHYAIDGYLAIIMTVIVWKASAALVDYFASQDSRYATETAS